MKLACGVQSGRARSRFPLVVLLVAGLVATAFTCRLMRAERPLAPALRPGIGMKLQSPAQAATPDRSKLDFDRDIEPIFQASCVICHSGQKAAARLHLDSESGVLQGGANGKVVIPGDSTNSLLMKRIIGQGDDQRMPLGRQSTGAVKNGQDSRLD